MDSIRFWAVLNEVLFGSQDLIQVQALEQRLRRLNGPRHGSVPVHRLLPCHGRHSVIVAKCGPQSLGAGGQEGLSRDGQETSDSPTECQCSEALISPILRLLEMLPRGGVLKDLVAVLRNGHDGSKRFFVPMPLERCVMSPSASSRWTRVLQPKNDHHAQQTAMLPLHEATVHQRQNTVNEVAVAAMSSCSRVDKIGPVEIRVMVFWHVNAEVIPQGIRIVALKERRKPNRMLS